MQSGINSLYPENRTASSSETSVHFYQTARHYISHNSNVRETHAIIFKLGVQSARHKHLVQNITSAQPS
jgi:hypothetical protein